MRPFIPDKEIVLTENSDLLKTKVYSDNLVRVIENSPKDKVFSIGLFGGWGAGKSSIIASARDKLENSKNKVKFITYDAWKYANDSFRRMFLLKVQEELKMQQCDEMRRFYRSETEETKPKIAFNRKGAFMGIIVLLILLLLLQVFATNQIVKLSATLGALGSFLVALLSGCFHELRQSSTKPILFAPEQFEDCFNQMMRLCFNPNNWLQKVSRTVTEYVTQGECSVKDLDKLVIVIDNIDRCPSDMAYQLLTDIKTFFCDEEYSIVFVVPVDEKALKKHLFHRWALDEDVDAVHDEDEFLRKFFNVVLRLKLHQETELWYFANELNSKYQLGYSPDTLAIVSKMFADNPRRIIQMLNNLNVDLSLYDDTFAKQYEATICAALILREEFPDYYINVVKNVWLLNRYATEKETNQHEQVNAFLRISSGVLTNVPTDVMQKIFTNTEGVLNDLPVEIKEAVCSFDSEKTIWYAKNSENNSLVFVAYLLNRLKFEKQYNAQSQMTQWVHYLVSLYDARVIGSSSFSDIDDCLSYNYASAIPSSKDASALCKFAIDLKYRGYPGFSNSLFSYVGAKETKSNANYHQVAHNLFSLPMSDKTVKENANIVREYYLENLIDNKVAFSDKQVGKIFNASFFDKLLNNEVNVIDAVMQNNIQWILSHTSCQTQDTIDALLKKFLGALGPTRAKKCDEFITYIKTLMPCLEKIQGVNDKTSIENLYKTVVGPRGVPRQGYQSNPNLDTKVSILHQVSDEQALVVVDFAFEAYRISKGTLDISDTLNKLFSRCSDCIYEKAARLIEASVSIKAIAPILANTEKYESTDAIIVTKHLLTPQATSGFMLDEPTLKAKIDSLLLYVNNTKVVSLIVELMEHEQVKSLFIERIIEKGLINTVPLSISRHLISRFNRETADTYKNNTEFLCLVASKGNAEQKKEVVRLVRKDLVNEINFDCVIQVLEQFKTNDKSILVPLLDDLKTATDSKTITSEQKEKILVIIERIQSKHSH